MCKRCKGASRSFGMVMLLWVAHLFAQGPDTLWTKTFGGPYDEYGFSIQETRDGGYILTGKTSSSGAGESDIWLIKTDQLGNKIWDTTFGGPEDDEGRSVRETKDNGYIVVGTTESYGAGEADIWLIKTNKDGSAQWDKTFGETGNEWGYSVQQTRDGGYILLGSMGMSDEQDPLAIKTDSVGNKLWTFQAREVNPEWGRSIYETTDSCYIMTGGGIQVHTTGGAGSPYNLWGYDIWIGKVNKNGHPLVEGILGSGNVTDEQSYSIQETRDGDYLIAGWKTHLDLATGVDVYLIKTNKDFHTEWDKHFGGTKKDEGYSVQQTRDGGYIIVGATESYGRGKADIWLIKTDGNGNELWNKTFGGVDDDVGYSVQETFDGGSIIVGHTYSFGAGGADVYLIKTKPDPTGIKESFQEISSIFECEPNPSMNRALIKYELPKNSNVHIVIYSLLGQEIRTLVSKKQNAGTHTIIWDGRDNTGERVSSGIYFLRFEACPVRPLVSYGAEGYKATRKLLIMR